MSDKYYCYSCGYKLQTEEEKKLGYIKKIDTEKEILYCKRCYDMIFHNKAPQTFLEDTDYWNLFRDIVQKKKSLFILIIDIFNISGSIIEKMLEELKNKKIILVLNKRDIYPKLVSDQKIEDNIMLNYPQLKNLNIKKIVIISTKKKYNIDILLEEIKNNLEEKVYLVGSANVGKSSLINALVNAILGDNKEYIATSYYSGTTLGLINIPLTENSVLIDTPGIINTSDLTTKLNRSSLDIIVPKSEIKPRTFQLNQGQTIFLTGFCQLNYVLGNKQGITLYISNQINPHRTKLENSEEIRKNHLGDKLLFPPTKKELVNIKFKKKIINIKKGNKDIVIDGLGWINIKNKNNHMLQYEIIVPENINVSVREGII